MRPKGKKKVLIWGTGVGYNSHINDIKYQEILGNIKIVGLTDRRNIYHNLDGYLFIPIEKIREVEIDYIVVTSEKYFDDICCMAYELGYDRKNLLPVSIFRLPNFDFSNYIELLQSDISIIANNCWGGLPIIVWDFNSVPRLLICLQKRKIISGC